MPLVVFGAGADGLVVLDATPSIDSALVGTRIHALSVVAGRDTGLVVGAVLARHAFGRVTPDVGIPGEVLRAVAARVSVGGLLALSSDGALGARVDVAATLKGVAGVVLLAGTRGSVLQVGANRVLPTRVVVTRLLGATIEGIPVVGRLARAHRLMILDDAVRIGAANTPFPRTGVDAIVLLAVLVVRTFVVAYALCANTRIERVADKSGWTLADGL